MNSDGHVQVPLMFDLGSYYMKCGFCGDIAPKFVFPCAVGKYKDDELIVGKDVEKRVNELSEVNYPIEHGIVKNWEDMENLFNGTYGSNVLDVSPQEHPLFITESPTRFKENKEKMATLLFERFSIPSMFVMMPAVLTLYSTGRTTGLVVECGGGVTNTTAINNSTLNFKSIKRSDVSGRSVTEYLLFLLSRRNEIFDTETNFKILDVIRNLKEQGCYIAKDYYEELRKFDESVTEDEITKEFHLPDGTPIKLTIEQFVAPEVLFSPYLYGFSGVGVHEMAYNTIEYERHGPLAKKRLYENVILSGGSTYIDGFHHRFENELKSYAPRKATIKVTSPENRKYASWVGGGVVSKISGFKDCWVTMEDYDDMGGSVVWRKCM